jgi:DNA-binding phage protein
MKTAAPDRCNGTIDRPAPTEAAAFLMGDVETGKALLRDYLNTTESIADIARELQVNEKSLRRMLGPRGNPTLKNLLSLLKVCSSAERFTLRVCHH